LGQMKMTHLLNTDGTKIIPISRACNTSSSKNATF